MDAFMILLLTLSVVLMAFVLEDRITSLINVIARIAAALEEQEPKR